MLPTLPTAEDELGSVLDNETHTSAHENNVRRLIEALATSPEMRSFPQGLHVGDATHFIRLNPATNLIEYGGDMRPVVPVPLLNQGRYQDYLGPIYLGSTADKARFYLQSADGDSTSWGSAFRRIGPGWDLTADVALKAVILNDAPIVTGVNDNMVLSSYAVVADLMTTRIDTKVNDWSSVNAEFTVPSSGGNYRVPREYTLGTDIDLSGYAAGNILSIQAGRDGAHANDDLGTAVFWMDLWLEVTLKSNAGV